MRLLCDYSILYGQDSKPFLREFSAVEVGGDRRITHFHIKSPCRWEDLTCTVQALNRSLVRSKHGLNFQDGEIQYQHFVSALKRIVSRTSALYAFGKERCHVLSQLTSRKFIDIFSEFGAPVAHSTRFSGRRCLYPYHGGMKCTLQTADIYSQWLQYYEHHLLTSNLCVKEDVQNCVSPKETAEGVDDDNIQLKGEDTPRMY